MGNQNFAERIADLDQPGLTFIHQIEQDLEFLAQKVSEDNISAAYRSLFRDHRLLQAPRGLVPALYEVRTGQA